MTLEPALRGTAGALVLVSALLAWIHSPYWLLLTALVGFNLLQSMLTDWCPMKSLLRALGLKTAVEEALERRGALSLTFRQGRP